MVGHRRALLLAVMAIPLAASARPLRPRFESTDLEMEEPGVIELDLQVGFVQSRGPYRVVAPDLEIDVGLLPALELDLQWTYAIEQPFDHSAGDNVWLAGKIALYDWHNPRRGGSWALALQLGPRLAAAPGASGIGFEALVLVAYVRGRLRVALNAGGIADPRIDRHHRPLGFETGVLVNVNLDARGRFSLAASLNTVYFLSVDPSQLFLTGGFSWSPVPATALSVTLLGGFLAGDDRIGVLLGWEQKIDLRPH